MTLELSKRPFSCPPDVVWTQWTQWTKWTRFPRIVPGFWSKVEFRMSNVFFGCGSGPPLHLLTTTTQRRQKNASRQCQHSPLPLLSFDSPTTSFVPRNASGNVKNQHVGDGLFQKEVNFVSPPVRGISPELTVPLVGS